MQKPHADIARNSLLLSNCPKDVQEDLLRRSIVKRFSRGQVLFDHGDPAHSVFVVLDGWIKLYRITPNGSEAIVGVFTRGHSFGEAVALRRGRYPVASEAATDCEVMQIAASDIVNTMRAYPEVCIAVLSSTLAHLHALVTEIEQLKSQSGAQRVAQFLLSLCSCDSGGCVVSLPFDKILIAGRIGMKPESLSRAFSRLRDHGVTIRQNHAEIADVAHLREFVDDEGGITSPPQAFCPPRVARLET